MMTIRQIARLWNAKSYPRLSHELLAARQEAQFGVEGLDRRHATAALAIIRMDELSQAHSPLYSQLVRDILNAQERDGGWGDPAVTALCVRALMLGDGQGLAIDAGLRYLATLQQEQGIWPAGPIRRMPQDPAASLFILYQLGADARFRSAVRFDDALEWFARHESILSAQNRSLLKWVTGRCRSFVGTEIEDEFPLFAPEFAF